MRKAFLVIAAVLVAVAVAAEEIPGTLADFSSGAVISSSTMNAHIDAIETAVDDNAADIDALQAGTGQTLGGDLSGTLSNAAVADNSHNHTTGNVTGYVAGHAVEDEGTPVTVRTKLNFTGAGVTCTDDAGDDATDCDIPGGGGSGATTDAGTVTHVTSATDDFAVGGTDSSAAFFVDESTGAVSCNVAGCSFSGTPAASTGDFVDLSEGSSNGSNRIRLQAPDSITSDIDWDLPNDAAPTPGEVLEVASVSAGVITLEWDTDDSGGGVAGTTFSECETLYAPTETIAATDDIPSMWRAPTALTITEVWCETDQTVTLDLQIDDGTPADVMGSDLSCGTGTADSTGLTGGMADGDRLDLAIATASGSPTLLTVCWEYDYD